MAIPTSVERVTVSSGEPLTLPDGTLLRGRLYFTAPALNIVPDDDYVFGGTSIAELVDGEFSIDLVPQDATGINPTGWSYTVKGEFYNSPDWTRYVQLTKDEPSVILSDVVDPGPVDPVFNEGYLPLTGGTMSGDIVLPQDPDQPLEAATKQYVDSGDDGKVDVSGDTMTGFLTLHANPNLNLHAAPRQYVDGAQAAAESHADAGDATRVAKAGDTMSGELNIQFGSINSNVGHDLSMSISTGIMHATGPITQASSTSVDVPAGLAMFVDPVHNHNDPKLDTVPYGGVTVSINNLSVPLTYLMVAPDGSIVQNTGVPTRAQRREFAVLGRVVVLGGNIVNVQDSPIRSEQPLATALDVVDALGSIRVGGLNMTPIGGTMTFSMTAGEIFNVGANYENNPADPNVSPVNAQSPCQFRYVTQNSVIDATPRTQVDPTIYDVGGTVTTVPGGSGITTIQRVHVFPTQNIFVQLGQNTFSNLTTALDALAVGESGAIPFVTHPDLRGGGVRTEFIVSTHTATDLGDTVTSRLIRATQFGNPGGL